jgi:hypothetical protein
VVLSYGGEHRKMAKRAVGCEGRERKEDLQLLKYLGPYIRSLTRWGEGLEGPRLAANKICQSVVSSTQER